MAARSSELDHLAPRVVRKPPRSTGNPAPDYSLRRQLAVIAPSLGDAVRYAGGWLFDQVAAGWDGAVITDEPADHRPARILGARVYDLQAMLSAPPADRRMHAIMVDANLYRRDPRVREIAQLVRCADLTELMLCGDDWPDSLDGAADPVRYRPSRAARAFKAHALAAAAVPVGPSADVEVFGRSRLSPLAAVPVASS